MLKNLDGFQILRRIAQSNTAEIFHVVRLVGRGRGSEYAAKVLREEYAGNRIERGHLETEYRICSALDHPYLIHAHDLDLDAPRPYLVMDLVHGGESLRDLLERGRPPLGPALGWLARAAEGLGHLHEAGYVHRDVKPQNLCIGAGGTEVKVIDFALATQADGSVGRYLLRRLAEWRRPGTWSYMAPEQIRNRRLTASADTYSLGVTIYEVATGRLPYAAPTAQELMEQHLYAPVPSITTIAGDAPAGLDELVRAMMAKDPLDRPAGMQYVCAKLRSVAAACRTGP